MTLLLILYVALGLLLIGLASPLVCRKIPPNHLYGFRVRRTLENREVWFAANAFAGVRLAWAGLATIAAAVLFYLLPISRLATYVIAVTAIMMLSLTVAVVQSFRYLYSDAMQSDKDEDKVP